MRNLFSDAVSDASSVRAGRKPPTLRPSRATAAFGYSLDETFDVGCDKGSPVTDEYAPLAVFTGRLIKVDFDLKPDFQHDPDAHTEAQLKMAMMRL